MFCDYQDDLCLWNLTVRETITFAAKLRLPQTLPEHEKEDRVTELLSMLGISHVANSILGKEGRRGISGGERKRVSIGVELITSPDVLFLDEPTSGLGEKGEGCNGGIAMGKGFTDFSAFPSAATHSKRRRWIHDDDAIAMRIDGREY